MTTHQHGYGDMAEILDLDAEVLAGHTADIVSWLPVGEAPRRIVDLGCGTGAGTVALLARFPDAHVTAIDSSTEHLARLREKVEEGGAAGRVDTVAADLDADWPDLGEPDLDAPDLIWASASLHHLADPDGALRRLHGALAPGGLLVVVEPDGFPRFLPDDAPADRPGLEGRCHEIGDRRAAERLPTRGADFGPRLAAAGFTPAAERVVTATVTGPTAGGSPTAAACAVGRYAAAGLSRIRGAVADTLSPEDLAALDRLLDPASPDGLLRRDDLAVRTTRTVWAVRAR